MSEEKPNGYSKYSSMFENIKKECEKREPDDWVTGPVVGREDKPCKHYVLESGLHVYIDGKSVYVSDGNVRIIEDGQVSKEPELYMSYDRQRVDMTYIDDRSYDLIEYVNREDDGRVGAMEDIVFLPSSFNPEDLMEAAGKINVRGNIPDDIEAAIAQYRGDGVTPEAMEMYLRMLSLNDRVREFGERVESTGKDSSAQSTTGTSISEIKGKRAEANELQGRLDAENAELTNIRKQLELITKSMNTDIISIDELKGIAEQLSSLAIKIEEGEARRDSIQQKIELLLAEIDSMKEQAHAEIDAI